MVPPPLEPRLLTGDKRIASAAGDFPKDELREILGRASFVALPHLTGTRSGAGVQAHAHGRPVVVSGVGAALAVRTGTR